MDPPYVPLQRDKFKIWKSKNIEVSVSRKMPTLGAHYACNGYVTPRRPPPRVKPALSDPALDQTNTTERTLRSKNDVNGVNSSACSTGSNSSIGVNRASSPILIRRRPKEDVQITREKRPRRCEITLSSDEDDEDDKDDSMEVACEDPISSDVYHYSDRSGDQKITITSSDLKCLNDGEFLNDVILDFYLSWLKDHEVDSLIAKRTHIFSTFFFSKLTQNPPNESSDSPGTSTPISQKYYARAKNWLKKVDIFSKDFVIVPVNRKSHWFLLIVCYPAEVPDVDDDDLATLSSPGDKSPCILIFDSLGITRTGGRYRLTDPLRHLFAAEYKLKFNRDKKFDHILLPDRTIKATQQTNCYDCGLFLLQYVEQFLAEPERVLKSTPGELKNWVDLKTISTKRKTIRSMIRKLSREQYAE